MARDALANDALAAALRSTGSLGAGAVQPITPHQYQGTPGGVQGPGGPTHMLSQQISPGPGKGGGAGGGQGGGAGSGLEKLGAGIAQGMKGFGAKQAQQKQFNSLLGQLPGSQPFRSPASAVPLGGGGASVSPIVSSPLAAAPYTPSPIGESGPLPSFAQGTDPGETGTSIGPASSLPSFASGMPGGSPVGTASNGSGFVDRFLTGIKAGEGVPYSGKSPTGAIGAYGLTGNFIKDYAPGAGLPSDRASYFSNPGLQDKLATYAAGQMYNKYGDWGKVANAWLTGSPTATTSAPGNMSPAAYDAKVMRAANAAPGGMAPAVPPVSQEGAAAYAAKMPSAADQTPQLAGPVPTSDTPGSLTGGQPVIPGQGDPHKPGFDESAVKFHDYHPEFSPGPGAPQTGPGLINGGQPGVYSAPDLQPPTGSEVGPQGMNNAPLDDQQMLAMALAQNNPDFNLSSMFGGGLFG